ncbi:MAG TPA: PAS domain-containing protein [Sedimentisphaerales bacterium]|nr:PAS domain-containing protein [Sedimentisphaerales bacterium]
MGKNQDKCENKVRGFWIASVVVIVLISMSLFTWWMVMRADQHMREELLLQTKMVAHSLDINHVKMLTGTDKDMESPDYLRLKEKFAAICRTNPKCHFVYLMGPKSDGSVFFFVDSQEDGPSQVSPPAKPGDVYDDASEELRNLFKTKVSFVEGPLSDEWGVWVSALVPLIDPHSGVAVAVLGIDSDAHDWNWEIVSHTALPVGLMLVLLIIAASSLVIWVNIKDRRHAENDLQKNEQEFQLMFNNAVSAVAVHKMLFDENAKPIDYIYLNVNGAFENQTGLKAQDVIGRRVTEILPGIEEAQFLEIYAKVVLTGESVSFEQYCKPLRRHYSLRPIDLKKITSRRCLQISVPRSRQRMNAGKHSFFNRVSIHYSSLFLRRLRLMKSSKLLPTIS